MCVCGIIASIVCQLFLELVVVVRQWATTCHVYHISLRLRNSCTAHSKSIRLCPVAGGVICYRVAMFFAKVAALAKRCYGRNKNSLYNTIRFSRFAEFIS